MAEYVPAPSYPNYSAFLTNLGQNLGENLSRQEPRQIAIDRQKLALQQQQQQAAQQKAIQDAFRGGGVMTNGAFDPRAAMSIFAGAGDIPDALAMAKAVQVQQQNQQAMNYQHPFSGGAAPPAAPFTGPPASAATGASTKAPGATGGTISELVSSALPATPVAASVATNIAKAVKVADPNAPLTDAQAAQARKLLDAYAKRQGFSLQGGVAGQNSTLSLFAAAAQRYGVSPDYLARTAQIESGGKASASNPSGASGLFQFMPKTAKEYGVNPLDPVSSTDGAARLAADNQVSLRKSLGRDPTDAELYLAHQQGAEGAAKLLENPNAKASSVVGMKSVIQNGGRPDMTAGQFAQMWTDRYNKTGGGTMNFGLSGPMQGGPGVVAPAGMQTGPLSGGVLPQIAPMPMGGQAAVPPPESIQAAQGGDQAPAPLAAPGVEPQQAAAPAPQAPAYHGYPLPEGYNNPVDAIKGLTEDINFLSRNPSPVAKARVKELEYERGEIAKSIEKKEKGLHFGPVGRDNTGQAIYGWVDPVKGTVEEYHTPSGAKKGSLESEDELNRNADLRRVTGHDPSLGFGGPMNEEKLRIINRANEREAAGIPILPEVESIAKRGAAYQGTVSGARAVGTYGHKLEIAANVAAAAIPKALAASEAVPRTEWVPVNKAILAYKAGTSDPALSNFAVSNQQVAETWSRAMNPSGQLHDYLVHLALDKLSEAKGKEAYKATLQSLWENIETEKKGVQQTYGEERGESTPVESPFAPSDAAALPSTPIAPGWSVETH